MRTPEVSVVVATYGRPDMLVRTLDSLDAQTLAQDRFEVVVVPNGPPSETPAVVAAYAAAHPGLDLRLVVTEHAGAAHARSVGVDAARGTYLTMVDDDDWVSPAYLERMLDAIRPGVIPLVDIADVAEGGEPSFDNTYSNKFRGYRGRTVPGSIIPSAMSFNVCKLIPTVTAREVGFDERLRSASDTLFWLRVYQRTRALLHVVDCDDAVYYRTTGDGSLSRQGTTWDFSVARRLDAYQSLAEIPADGAEVEHALLARTAGSLARHMNYFLRDHPDQHDAVAAEVRRRALPNVAWKRANLMLAAEVLLVHDVADPGFGDPLWSLRAIAARGEVTDLFGTVPWRDVTPWVPPFAEPFVGSRESALVRGRHDPWEWPQAMVDKLGFLEQRRRDDGRPEHTRLRSLDATGVAHLAAAAVRRTSAVTWTATFDRPLAPSDADPLTSTDPDVRAFAAGLGSATTLPALALEAIGAYADRLVFVSAPLRDAVLDRLPAGSRERAAAISTVEPPVALPPWTADGVASPFTGSPERVDVGVLVTGDPGPALTCVGEALLDLPEVRDRLRLHLVGTDHAVLRRAAYDARVGDLVVLHEPPPVAGVLASLPAYDALLLPDGPWPGLVPPAYLPDAIASGTPTWRLHAPGDRLGGGTTWAGATDDPAAARAVLAEVVAMRTG